MQSNFKRWIVAALPLAMACQVCAQGKVSGVSTQVIDGGLAVHIAGANLDTPTTRWDDGAVVLTFDAKLSARSKTWRPNQGGIKAVSYARVGKKVDVAVRPTHHKAPEIVKVTDGWLVFFEEPISATVPKLKPASAILPTQVAQQRVAKPSFAPVNPRDFKPKSLVTLNFVNTDIVQILKALAMQSNVNVAMGPDVTGKVTINLENVPVDDAMDMVTTLGGVRYAYVNNTYIVSSKSQFAETMESIYGRSSMISDTRVIPLFSREGSQVKAAILKMVPPSTEQGRYELVLPSEKLNVLQTQSVTPGDSKDGKAGGGGDTQTNTKVQQLAENDSTKKDDYIVLIGTPSRMDSVEKAVRSLDGQICDALGIKVGESQAIVRKTYEPNGILASELVKALVGSDSKSEFNGVQIMATPKTSVSQQAVVLSGREYDVDRVLAMLIDLDKAPDAAETQYQVVDLRYVQPQIAFVQVMQAVPGIRASLLPPPINPKLGIDYKETSVHGGGAQDANNGGTPPPATDNGGSGGSTGAQGQGATGGSSNGQLGSGGSVDSSVVKTSTKSNSIPMKLLLRGTEEQIAAAREYLAMVDVQPKQVAVELRVMELTHEEALKVGLDWSLLTGGTVQSLHLNQSLGDDTNAGGIGGTFVKGTGKLSVLGLLDQLSTKNNVLARPSILVNDGVPTNIFVGDEVRYVKSITTSQNGPTVITDEVDVGVDFSVVARVGSGGNIMLDLAPTLKVLEGFTPVPGGGSLPQTSRRSAESQMSIKSGETIAIGGLIQDQDRKSYGGIPILRDLPIIGRLFGRTDNRKVRSEVVFFVTVREVDENNRQGAANPNQAERDNTKWPGNKDGKKGG